MDSALVRSSAVVALLGVFAESAAAFLDVTPFASRIAPWAWAPFVTAVSFLAIAGALAGSPFGRRPLVAAPLGLAAAVCLGLGMAGLGHAAFAGAGVSFAAALIAGEMVAAGAVIAGAADSIATAASLFAGALAIGALSVFGDRLDVALTEGGTALGGALALLQLAVARYGDGAVALRFGEKDVVPAAVARLTEAPRRLILAVLGQQPV
jgi:hypothetical protein